MKKIFYSVVCIVALFSSMFNAYATETGIGLSESKTPSSDKVICTATLEDHFADDTVLVVINKEYSKRDTVFTASHFPTVQVDAVRNITSPIGDLFKESRTEEEEEKKVNILALTNVEEFRQIIEIKLTPR